MLWVIVAAIRFSLYVITRGKVTSNFERVLILNTNLNLSSDLKYAVASHSSLEVSSVSEKNDWRVELA